MVQKPSKTKLTAFFGNDFEELQIGPTPFKKAHISTPGLDRPVASLRSPRLQRLECLACLVHDSGSSGAELVRWLRGEGFEVWEDAFAKASYVSLDTWNGRSPKS